MIPVPAAIADVHAQPITENLGNHEERLHVPDEISCENDTSRRHCRIKEKIPVFL